jgi:DNA polymerase-3 subunit alpha (Gram-positive type)
MIYQFMKESIKNMAKPLKDVRFVVVDVETTGLDPEKERICEISMTALKNLESVSSFTSLINPQIIIPPEVLMVHGIDNKMVEESPSFIDIADIVMDFISGSVLVGHNIEFDFGFLKNEMKRAGYNIENFILIDTVKLSRKIYTIENYKLKTIANYLDIQSDRFHRAGDDVEVTVKIFQNIIRTLKSDYGIDTLESLIEFIKKN